MKDSEILRAVIYARVSSDRQKADNTISNQLRTLPKWIAAQGWKLVCIYQDEGKSASPGKLHLRGGFQQLLADCSKGDFDVVVVVDLDRITRTNDWWELGMIFGPFQKHGIAIAGPGLGRVFYLGEGMSDIELIMRIKFAYEDNETRRRKLRDGKEGTALRGGHVSGVCPYGLTYTPNKARDGSGWGHDPEKKAIVEEIYRLALGGMSGHQIGKLLEARRTPGPQVNEKKPNGGRWVDNAVIRILRSPVYRGLYHSKSMPIRVPAIIDEETWYAVQGLIKASKKRGIGKPHAHYLCYGIAVCTCGGSMYMRHADGKSLPNGKRQITRRYVCRDATHRALPGKARCKLPSFVQERIDALIWGEVAAYLARPAEDILAELAGYSKGKDEDGKAWAEDVKRYSAMLDDLDRRQKVIVKLAMSEDITEQNLADQLAENKSKRLTITKQLETAQAALSANASSVDRAKGIREHVVMLKQVAEKADAKQRMKVVQLLISRGGIVFDPHGVTVFLDFTEGPRDLKETPDSAGNCRGSMVKNHSQVPARNVVVLRVVTGV